MNRLFVFEFRNLNSIEAFVIFALVAELDCFLIKVVCLYVYTYVCVS